MSQFILMVRSNETRHLGPKYGFTYHGIFNDEQQALNYFKRMFHPRKEYDDWQIIPLERKGQGNKNCFISMMDEHFYFPILFGTWGSDDEMHDFIKNIKILMVKKQEKELQQLLSNYVFGNAKQRIQEYYSGDLIRKILNCGGKCIGYYDFSNKQPSDEENITENKNKSIKIRIGR
jgi:hypothetical protein